jgi:hypothetical protein
MDMTKEKENMNSKRSDFAMRAAAALVVSAAATEPVLATTVGAAGTGFVSTLNNIWQMIQAGAYPIAGIGLTVGLGALYAQHHGFKEVSHGVLNGALLAGGVLTAGGLIGALVPGTAGALI